METYHKHEKVRKMDHHNDAICVDEWLYGWVPRIEVIELTRA